MLVVMQLMGADLSVGDDLTVNGGVIELKNSGAAINLSYIVK